MRFLMLMNINLRHKSYKVIENKIWIIPHPKSKIFALKTEYMTSVNENSNLCRKPPWRSP